MTMLKGVCRALLHRFGYEVQRNPVSNGKVSPEELTAQTGDDAIYYMEYSTPWPVFAPWVGDPSFRRLYDEVASITLGTPERAYMLMGLAQHARHLRGDFAECGVYQGGSALMLCRVLKGIRKTLRLFDSFAGLPNPHRHDRPEYDTRGEFQAGEMACALDLVKRRLSDFREFTEFHDGWIPDTFQGLDNHQYAFAHIDVDLYQSTLDCCAYFYPRLTPGGILLFDEYGWPSTHGEKVAVDEFFADKTEHPIPLITGQAVVFKIPPGSPL